MELSSSIYNLRALDVSSLAIKFAALLVVAVADELNVCAQQFDNQPKKS